MSRPSVAARLAPAVAAVLAAAASASAQELPARRPGLWEVTLQTTNAPSQTVRQCIDEKTDAAMQRFTQGLDLKHCSRNSWRRDGERHLGEAECRLGASTMTSRSVFSGDFSRSYRGEIDSRYQPPVAGVGHAKVTIVARWVGACPAGWTGGDIEVPGMGRMNVSELMAGRGPKPR
jgi:hypothetical protein